MHTKYYFEIKDLSYVREERIIFSSVFCGLNAGETLWIEGPNGSGKSTLLRTLAGLATPSTGEIHWQNKIIYANNPIYLQQLHYIGHTNGIKCGLTVMENLQLAGHLALAKLPPSLTPLLNELRLDKQQNSQARYLSAGQKRRLALAKLFLFPKKIWILDEPFTALDAQSQTFFATQLEKHVLDGGICIMSSHQTIHSSNITTHHLRLEEC